MNEDPPTTGQDPGGNRPQETGSASSRGSFVLKLLLNALIFGCLVKCSYDRGWRPGFDKLFETEEERADRWRLRPPPEI